MDGIDCRRDSRVASLSGVRRLRKSCCRVWQAVRQSGPSPDSADCGPVTRRQSRVVENEFEQTGDGIQHGEVMCIGAGMITPLQLLQDVRGRV